MTDAYSAIWTAILFGAALGSAMTSVIPPPRWALSVAFAILAVAANPFIQWVTQP